MDLPVFVALIVGLVAGALVSALVSAALAAAGRRTVVAELAAVRRDAERACADRDTALARAEQARQQLEQATERAGTLQVELASARTALEAQRAAAAEREQVLARREGELKESFQALSAEVLSRNSAEFIRLAESKIREATAALTAKADGDAAQRQQAIEALLGPVTQTLHRLDGQLRTVEKDREAAYAGLREQVKAMHRSSEQLQTETRQLVNALRAPQVRGRWGELQLERIVELAGMVEHCDFSRQVSATNTDGDDDALVRPDLIVRLTGGKQIVVDAKVPFGAYLEAIDATDPDRRAERMSAHARHLRHHVDSLAHKSYWQRFEPSPEFVVLFVPGDPFLEAALQADPAVLEHAFGRNVVIATPTTMIALLRTVAYTWRQEVLARNAGRVNELGRELHTRLATMGTHFAKLGRQLGGAVDAYNSTVKSLESRVLVTARRFAELRVVHEELGNPEQVELTPRALQATELVAVDTDLRVTPDEAPAQAPDASADAVVALRPAPPATEPATEEDWRWVAEQLNQESGEDSRASTVNG